MAKVNRGKELEQAVKQYLDLKGYKYISSSNQRARCPDCGRFFNVPSEGWDVFVFWPIGNLGVIECKANDGALSKSQKEWQERCKKWGIPYIVVRRNLDALIDGALEGGGV